MELEARAARVLRAVPLAHEPRPDAAAGAEAGDLLEERQRDVEEEREARQELVGIHAAATTVVGILQRVANVKAIASAGVAPACCMCWPTTDIGFHFGKCRLQNSM
jgi:hypothetical protein